MVALDIFNADPFSARSMTAAVDKVGYVPGYLGSIPNLFLPVPVRTETVFIEARENAPALLQADQPGDPIKDRAPGTRQAFGAKCLRIAEKSRINAATLQNIRAFGSESDLQQVQTEVAQRQILLRRDVELTREHYRLGLVQGIVYDADGTTELFNWPVLLNQPLPAEIDFDLDNASPATGAVRKKCNQVTRSIIKALKGLGGNGVSIHSLCGDAFWDDLTGHKEIRETYLNTAQAQDLRGGNAWESFPYGGITWVNYRGSDDGKVGIKSDAAKFFPVGAGIFQIAQSPAETFDFVNTLGRELYSWIELDPAVNKKWAEVQMLSYPTPVCTMPAALHRARRS